MRPLRVLTWNLWWRFGPWRERQGAIASVLADLDADLVGLQEVWSTADRHFAAELADGLGLQWTGCASALRDDGVRIGNAVLSRWPIVTTRHSFLTPSAATEGRTVMYAEIDAPFGTVPFFTTQLSSAPYDSALRCAQVREVADFVLEHASSSFPPILTGDLNAEPDSDEIRLLCGHKTAPAMPGLVLVDVWRYAERQAPADTWDRANPFVLATHEPSARIDYVLVGVPGSHGQGHVRAARRVADAPVSGVWPSDHAGVLAELSRGR